MNNRRKLIVALGASALAWVGAIRAQAPAKVRRIALLSPVSPADAEIWHDAFRKGLRDLGWIEGTNLGIEYRYAEGKIDRLPQLAADVVRLNVSVIVASGLSDSQAAQRATKEIPIVFASVGDPVAGGLVKSLARPGGNVTGLSQMTFEMVGKRLELLKEAVPKLASVGVLWNPKADVAALPWKEIQLPARLLGIQIHSLAVSTATEIDHAFEVASNARVGALFVIADPVTVTSLKRIAALAASNRLPSIFQWAEFVDYGGLISYGPDRTDMYRRAATYVDKILRGAKSADLPVEQPMTFEMVVNLRTAKLLGLTMPPEIMVRATRVIQ